VLQIILLEVIKNCFLLEVGGAKL